MSCDAWHELLIAFLDGEIESADRARLESHLEGCAACKGDLTELQTTSAVLRRWEPADPPAELVFVARRRRGGIGQILEGIGRSVLVPAGVGAALAATVAVIVLGQRGPDRELSELRAELASLKGRVASAESAVRALPAMSVPPAVTAGGPTAGAASETDLSPATRAWLVQTVDGLVRRSESRQDAKLVLAADQVVRSLALQRREDLSFFDRKLRDTQAETFEALVSTHQRLDQLAPAERLEPR